MKDLVIDEKYLEKIQLLQLSINEVLQGQFLWNYKTKSFGLSTDFADCCKYIPGDDTSKIDWNVFARAENLFLKLFVDEIQLHTRIYINTSGKQSEIEFNGTNNKAILYDSENKRIFYKNNINRNEAEAYQESFNYASSHINKYCEIIGANYLLIPSNRLLEDIFFKDLMSMEVVR